MWTKPKKLLRYLLAASAWASVFFSIIAAVVLYIWVYMPDVIRDVDEGIGLKFKSRLISDFDQAEEFYSDKNFAEACASYQLIFSAFKDVGKYDVQRKKKRLFLKHYISCLMTLGNHEEAKIVSDYWVKSDVKDVDANLWQIRLLRKKVHDKEHIDKMYEALRFSYSNVISIMADYVEHLVESGDVDKAYKIQNEFYEKYNIFYENDLGFKLYFKDGGSGFSEKNTMIKRGFPAGKTDFNLTYTRQFKSFDAVRLDIEENKSRFHRAKFLLKNLRVTVENETVGTSNMNEVIKSNNFDSQSGGGFIVGGKDPYIVFSMPEDFLGVAGEVVINISFDFDMYHKDYVGIAKKKYEKH
jgi:tetratricopeptide (TPR) repeat protein